MPRFLRFGPFEVDTRSGELSKFGSKIRLHQQPFKVLLALIRQPGEVVLREEIRQTLWPGETVVEFEHGINATMQRLRDALGDSARNPRYIETLPRRGYRFLAAVEPAGPDSPALPAAPKNPAAPAVPDPARAPDASLNPAPAILSLSGRHRTAAFAVAGLAAFGLWWTLATAHRASMPGFERLSYRRGIIQGARFAPGGGSVYYAASWEGQPVQIFQQQLGSREARSLGLKPAGLLAIADGGKLAVSAECALQWTHDCVGTLAEIVSHGPPREILEGVQFADWTKDGASLAVAVKKENGAARLEFPQGHVVFRPKGTGWPGDPRISPNGELVAFIDHFYSGDDGTISVADLHGRTRTLTPVFDTVQGLAWSPDGKEIWFTAAEGGRPHRSLRAVSLSGTTRVILQLPVNLKLHDIARDGRILLSKLDSRTRVFFAGAGGAAPKDLTWFEYATNPGLSADGRTLLMTANDESTGGKALTIVRRTDGSASVRLGEYHGISLSPDGRWVAATAIHQPQPAEITLLPVKAGPPVRLPIGPLQLAGDELAMLPKVGWLPGGSRILFPAKQPGRAPRTFIQDTGGGQPRPLTPEGTWGWLLTPDGRFLLVYDAAANASLFPVEGGGAPQPLPFLKPEFVPLNFTTDGRSLFVCRRGASPAVWRMDLSNGSLDAGRAIPLPDPSPNFFNNQSLRITPDGQSIAYVVNTRLDELYVVHGLR